MDKHRRSKRITITLAVLLFAAAIIAGVSIRHNKVVEAKYKRKCSILKAYKEASKETNPRYYVRMFNGKLFVTRVAYIDGSPFESIIKVFDDEDFEFNILCAEELCEHLNQK